MGGIDIDPEVTTQPRRHTDGVQTRESKGAVTNTNPGHWSLLSRCKRESDGWPHNSYLCCVAAAKRKCDLVRL
jgi:hypothetical protein